ncbi:MAG: hypothetical protein AABZ74_11390 [Cyanobacteriota bacterium]
MFRHSIVETGNIYVRVSTRGLAKNVITSSYSNSKRINKPIMENLNI